MPPSLNDPVFVFTAQCFFLSPCTSTHHHLLLRKPPPPPTPLPLLPPHRQGRGTFRTSCRRTLPSLNMSVTLIATKWITNKWLRLAATHHSTSFTQLFYHSGFKRELWRRGRRARGKEKKKEKKTGQQDWTSFNCNLPRNRHTAVCPMSHHSFTKQSKKGMVLRMNSILLWFSSGTSPSPSWIQSGPKILQWFFLLNY